MNNRATFLLLACLLLAGSRVSAQQFAFGMQYSCEPEDAYAKVTLPASALADLVRESGESITMNDICMDDKPVGTLSGYQADYDGDGTDEMWLLYTNNNCNVTVIVTPAGGGKYALMDILPLPTGKALIRPIITLDKGVQMYAQSSSTLPDGGTEVKGSILWYQQTALIILTSWSEFNGMRDGKHVSEAVDAAWTDGNFDKIKELVVRYSIHETGGGKRTEKNMVDRYVLTLDFLPNHLRYGVYDSVGMAALDEAEKKARTARGRMNREETRDAGIVAMREAIQTDPFMVWARVHLGEFLLHDGKYSDAAKTLIEARKFGPENNKLFRILGDAYLRLNDLQLALEAYTRYLEVGPESNYYKKKVEHNIKQITIPKRRR